MNPHAIQQISPVKELHMVCGTCVSFYSLQSRRLQNWKCSIAQVTYILTENIAALRTISWLSVGGDGGEPAAKRLCRDVKEGEQIIVGVLARVRGLLETFGDGEEEKLKESLQMVREEVLSSANPYIQAIFSTNSMVSFPDH